MKDLSQMLNNAARDERDCIRPPVFTDKEAPWMIKLLSPSTTSQSTAAYQDTYVTSAVSGVSSSSHKDGRPSSTSNPSVTRRAASGSSAGSSHSRSPRGATSSHEAPSNQGDYVEKSTFWENKWKKEHPGLRRGECQKCFGNHKTTICPNGTRYYCNYCKSWVHWKINCNQYQKQSVKKWK